MTFVIKLFTHLKYGYSFVTVRFSVQQSFWIRWCLCL